MVVGGGTLLLDHGVGLAVGLTAVVYAAAMYLASRIVEGPRKAMDRLVTILVTAAFLVAMAPLVSVVVTVLANGIARFDVEFFTYSMRGVVGEGGGAYHALLGTLIITVIAAILSVPVGLLTAIYLVEYGEDRPGPGHHLLRGRHDRHPVDRRRPVRLRAFFAGRRPGRRWASARSHCPC